MMKLTVVTMSAEGYPPVIIGAYAYHNTAAAIAEHAQDAYDAINQLFTQERKSLAMTKPDDKIKARHLAANLRNLEELAKDTISRISSMKVNSVPLGDICLMFGWETCELSNREIFGFE